MLDQISLDFTIEEVASEIIFFVIGFACANVWKNMIKHLYLVSCYLCLETGTWGVDTMSEWDLEGAHEVSCRMSCTLLLQLLEEKLDMY